MAHRADALNDIFEHNVLIRETCQANKFIGDGSQLTGISTGATWETITGNQTTINLSGFTNDAGFITGNPFDQDLNTYNQPTFAGEILTSNLEGSSSTAFDGTQTLPYGTFVLGRVLGGTGYYGQWDGNGFTFSNTNLGSGNPALSVNGDTLFFGDAYSGNNWAGFSETGTYDFAQEGSLGIGRLQVNDKTYIGYGLHLSNNPADYTDTKLQVLGNIKLGDAESFTSPYFSSTPVIVSETAVSDKYNFAGISPTNPYGMSTNFFFANSDNGGNGWIAVIMDNIVPNSLANYGFKGGLGWNYAGVPVAVLYGIDGSFSVQYSGNNLGGWTGAGQAQFGGSIDVGQQTAITGTTLTGSFSGVYQLPFPFITPGSVTGTGTDGLSNPISFTSDSYGNITDNTNSVYCGDIDYFTGKITIYAGYTFDTIDYNYQAGSFRSDYYGNLTATSLNLSDFLVVQGNLTAQANVNFSNLPTSSAGLNTGDVWNNGGVLNIV